MKIITKITILELTEMSKRMFMEMVKADVDLKQNIILIDMDMHADGESYLLEHGSKQEDLWGVNLYPKEYGMDNFIEYDSMINLRPRTNRSRIIQDENIKKQIKDLILKAIDD
jgi:hypothetical protein